MDAKRLMQELDAWLAEAQQALDRARSLREVEQLRVQFLGKKGRLSALLKEIGRLPAEQRPKIGRVANEAKQALAQAIEQAKARLQAEERQRRIEAERIDPTLPGRRPPQGARHPLSEAIAQMCAIFERMGFVVAEGPEIETEKHNFDDLNIPPEHPARAMHDTFFVANASGYVLRTHTSPVQLRAMRAWRERQGELPLAVVAPGRVFRCDDDATHSPMFHQIEGFLLDRHVSLADLKGVLHEFLAAWFERDLPLRLRPSYFPFTEPSVEVDLQCVLCNGQGCRVCEQTGWLEVLGAGMIHPHVLQAAGIDFEEVSGFAFGLGVERLVMLKRGVSDLRLFFAGDLRFVQGVGR